MAFANWSGHDVPFPLQLMPLSLANNKAGHSLSVAVATAVKTAFGYNSVIVYFHFNCAGAGSVRFVIDLFHFESPPLLFYL